MRLINKYTRDPAKTALIESVFARAVTVSERNHIMEKRAAPKEWLVIPPLSGNLRYPSFIAPFRLYFLTLVFSPIN
jgi:hypothetical protein